MAVRMAAQIMKNFLGSAEACPETVQIREKLSRNQFRDPRLSLETSSEEFEPYAL